MNRFLGRLLAGAAIIGGASALSSACVHNDQTLFVQQVVFPEVTAAGVGCTYTADPTLPSIGSGILDVAFRPSYTAMVLVGNQMVARASTEQGRVETSRIILQGATVRLTDSSGTEVSSFTRLGAGVVEPSRGVAPSYGLMEATLIDPKTANMAAAELAPGTSKRYVAFFKIFGTTLGGTSVESAEYQFPIDVCFRCLVDFRDSVDLDVQDAQCGRPNCAKKAEITTVPCVRGQDIPLHCSSCYPDAPCDPTFTGSPADPTTWRVAPFPPANTVCGP